MAAASQYLKLNPNEIALFDRLFSLVEDPNTGVATGAQVSGLFLTSGLPRPTLATIWNIASAGKGGKLDKDGFFIGCRLISIAQQNLPVTQESLLVHLDLPLPMFQGHVQQFYSRDQYHSFPAHAGVQSQRQDNLSILNTMAGLGPGTSQIMPNGASMPQLMAPSQSQPNIMHGQNHPLPQTTMKPISQMISTAQQTRVLPPGPATGAIPPALPPNNYSQGSANGASDASRILQQSSVPSAANSRRSSVQTDALWEISPEKRETYLKYFDQADADKDGFVNGKEAKTFFTMSKLSATVLRDIWLLSDIDQDNRLNKEEFTIAMHLTMAVRMSGVPLPAQLPEPLMQYYKRQTQRFQSSGNDKIITQGLSANQNSTTSMIAQPSAIVNMTASITTPPINASQPAAPIPATMTPQIVNVDHSAEKTEYARQISSVKAQIEEQKIAIQGYQSRVPNYEEELQNLKIEAKAAEETLEALTAERRQHQTAFEKIRSDIASAKADIDTVNSKVTEERTSISNFQDKISQGTRELEELRLKRDNLQKSVDDLKHQIQDKELAVVCLEQEMEDVRKQIDHINEVSSYQLQIMSKVTSDHEDREKQLAELFATKAELDRLKGSPSTTAGTSSASAPISPLKNPTPSEPGWVAQPLSASLAVQSIPNALIPEEFTFPEFSDDDFHGPPLKSAPVSVTPVIDLGKSANLSGKSAVSPHDTFSVTPEKESHQPGAFPIDAGASNLPWDPKANDAVKSVSSKAFEMNPFEADDNWNIPVKPSSASSSESGKLQSVSSQTLNTESIAWPSSDFGVPTGSDNGDWAQF